MAGARANAVEDLDARNPGPHDRRGAGKARRRQRDLRGAFLGRRAGRAYRARLPATRRRSRDAGAGRLSVARRRRPIQQARRHAGDRSAARLHRSRCRSAIAAPNPARAACSLPQAMPDGFVNNTATPLLLRPREFLANARDLVTLRAAVAEQAPRYADITAPITIIAGDADKTVSTQHPFAAAGEDRTERQADRAARRRPHGPVRRARSRDLGDRGDQQQDGTEHGGSRQLELCRDICARAR